VLFYTSFIKTLITLPGFIPQNWKNMIQKEIEAYLHLEKE